MRGVPGSHGAAILRPDKGDRYEMSKQSSSRKYSSSAADNLRLPFHPRPGDRAYSQVLCWHHQESERARLSSGSAENGPD